MATLTSLPSARALRFDGTPRVALQAVSRACHGLVPIRSLSCLGSPYRQTVHRISKQAAFAAAPAAGAATEEGEFDPYIFQWQQLEEPSGGFLCGLKNSEYALLLRNDDDQSYTLQFIDTKTKGPPVLKGTLPEDLSLLANAEIIIRNHYAEQGEVGVDRLLRQDAPWRSAPATVKQLAMMNKMNIPHDPAHLTKGAAAEAMNLYLVKQFLARGRGGPSTSTPASRGRAQQQQQQQQPLQSSKPGFAPQPAAGGSSASEKQVKYASRLLGELQDTTGYEQFIEWMNQGVLGSKLSKRDASKIIGELSKKP